MWQPPTLKQVLVNQHGPQQLHRPLGRTPLVTACKDADLWHTSQSQPCLHWDSLSGVQTATVSLPAAAPSADSRKTGRLAGAQLACNQPVTDTRKTSHLPMQGRLMNQPTAARDLPAFIGCALPLSYGSFRGLQHLTGYRTLPACPLICILFF